MPSLLPPVAPKRPSTRIVHGDVVHDDYAWMADREDPALRSYLEAENAYAAGRTEHLSGLVDEIFGEIKTRTKETDLGVPVRHDGWWYYSRTIEGEQYSVAGRVAVADHPDRPSLAGDAAPQGEQVIIDENLEARGHDFFSLGASDVSPDGTLLAYAVDVVGDERFALKVRRIEGGELVDEAVTDIGYGVAWSKAGSHLFYTRVDDAWRAHEVWRHAIGTPAEDDVLVVAEPDERFSVGVGSSRDDRWVVIGIGSKTTSEYHLIDAADPLSAPVVVAPRVDGVEYDVEPLGEEVLVVHNRHRLNFEVARAVVGPEGVGEWTPLDLTAEDEYVTGVEAFADVVVLSLRSAGQTALRVVARDPGAPTGLGRAYDIDFDEPVRSVSTGENPDPAATSVQVLFGSLVTPPTVYDVDLATGGLTLLKRKEVLGGYDPADYTQRLDWAVAPDGTRVPLSVVHRRDTPLDGTAPGLLYGYGSYGISMDPWFSVARLSLLDRGFVFALAHVRGGSEMGRAWYDNGKMEHKEHTFTDFVACADHLVEEGLVHPERLAAEGGSAGGLLMGAVANLAPSRFRVLHAQVPFVDPLTTILDPSLPLTVSEWEEWGNPVDDPEAYRRMKAYSPYENLGAHPYPAILVTTSINDTRVFVTEPAKWVARLRTVSTSDPETAPVLFRTELTAGHAGLSGRYDAWRQLAWEWAVLVDQTRGR
ncbi:MAG: S9 family peptidase [Lapillicoccus sp.]